MLLLVIGVVVTEISVWGRRQQAAASRRAGYLDGLNGAARAVAVGGSPSALMDQVTSQLIGLLSLRSCRFQYGIAGVGRPARPRSRRAIRLTRANAVYLPMARAVCSNAMAEVAADPGIRRRTCAYRGLTSRWAGPPAAGMTGREGLPG